MRFNGSIILALIFTLAACAQPPTAEEISVLNVAPKPSSQEAAEQAVKNYFRELLIDAESARYEFPLPPIKGSFLGPTDREFGWFMCGIINGKNRMDGYSGYSTFYVYFSPAQPDTVIHGEISDITDEYHFIDQWCNELYGPSHTAK
jgi:hypothetical protein